MHNGGRVVGSALQAALARGRLKVVKLLLDGRPNVNAQGGGIRQRAGGSFGERLPPDCAVATSP
jgi:hypothetical protein